MTKRLIGMVMVCMTGMILSGCSLFDSKENLSLQISGEEIEIPAKNEVTQGTGWTLENKDGDYVLTLSGANLKQSPDDKSGAALCVEGDLSVVLQKGTENSIQAQDYGIKVAGGELVIRGQGSLSIQSDNTGIAFESIGEENRLIMQKGTVDISAGNIGIQDSHFGLEGGSMSVYADDYGIFGGYEGKEYAQVTTNAGDLSVEGGYIALYCDRTKIEGGTVELVGLLENSFGLYGQSLTIDLQNGSLHTKGESAAIAAEAYEKEEPQITLGSLTKVSEEGVSLKMTSYQEAVESQEGSQMETYQILTYTTDEQLYYDIETQTCQNAALEITFERSR